MTTPDSVPTRLNFLANSDDAALRLMEANEARLERIARQETDRLRDRLGRTGLGPEITELASLEKVNDPAGRNLWMVITALGSVYAEEKTHPDFDSAVRFYFAFPPAGLRQHFARQRQSLSIDQVVDILT